MAEVGLRKNLVVFLIYLRGGKSGRLLGVGPLDNERGANEWCHLSAELRVFVWTPLSLNDPSCDVISYLLVHV